MRKMSTVMLCLLLTSSILSACGGNNKVNNAPSDPSAKSSDTEDKSDKKVTLKIHYPTPDLKEARVTEDEKINRFQTEYPNVEIVKDDWQYNVSEIGIKMASNEAPTYFNTYATEAKFLAEKGWLADITELYNKWEYKDEMNSILQEQFIVNGKVLGVTENGYITSTIVNKKMLDEKGVAIPSYDWTWEDMLSTAKAVSDPSKGIAGIAPMGKGNEAGWNWTNFLFQAGGEIQNVSDGKVTATFSSEAGLKALDFYRQLKWEANAIPQDWALGWGDAVGAFQQSRAAMVVAGASDVIEPALNQGGLKPEEVLTFPMPASEKGGKHTGILGGNYLVINPNATPEEQEMAFKYITFDYFSDKGLEALDVDIKARKDEGKYFVPPLLQYFNAESEFGLKVKAIYEKYDNVYQYDPAIMELLDGKPEAQYNTQDYYAAMSDVIQELFSKEGTDLKTKLETASKFVQEKYFDSITVE